MRVKVDANVCMGSEACVEACPEVFQMNKNGVSEVQVDEVPESLEESVREAASDCPTGAIMIEE
jgi:ferredoxin